MCPYTNSCLFVFWYYVTVSLNVNERVRIGGFLGKAIARIGQGGLPWERAGRLSLPVVWFDGGCIHMKGYHPFPVLAVIPKVLLCFL